MEAETTFGTEPVLAGPEFPRVLSSSMRASFSTCPRKFQWEQIYGYIPKDESVHLIFGSVYASAIEEYRKGYYGTKYQNLPPKDRLSEALADALYVAI